MAQAEEYRQMLQSAGAEQNRAQVRAVPASGFERRILGAVWCSRTLTVRAVVSPLAG